MKMKRLAILLLAAVLAFPLASCAKREPEALRIEDLFETVCSANEALALSRKANAVVLETRGCTSGGDVWNAFYQTAQSGAPASVLCAHYLTLDPAHMSEELYEREKDKYPRMQFYQVEYDGKEYSVKVRESTAQSPSDRAVVALRGIPAGATVETENLDTGEKSAVATDALALHLPERRSSTVLLYRIV